MLIILELKQLTERSHLEVFTSAITHLAIGLDLQKWQKSQPKKLSKD